MERHYVEYQLENVDSGEVLGWTESGMFDTREEVEAWFTEFEESLPNNVAVFGFGFQPNLED